MRNGRLAHTLFRHTFKGRLTFLLFCLFGGILGIHIGAAVMLGTKLTDLLSKAIPTAAALSCLSIAFLSFPCHSAPSVSSDHRTSVYIDVRAEFNSSVICPDGRYYRTQFGTYINCENFDAWHEGLDKGLRQLNLEMKFPL